MGLCRLNIVRSLRPRHASHLELIPQQDRALFLVSASDRLLALWNHLHTEGGPLTVTLLCDVNHVVFDFVDVFEHSDDFSRTHKNFQGFELTQLVHGFDASLRTDHYVAVCCWLATHFGKDVFSTEKDVFGRHGYLVVVELV